MTGSLSDILELLKQLRDVKCYITEVCGHSYASGGGGFR